MLSHSSTKTVAVSGDIYKSSLISCFFDIMLQIALK